MRWRAGRMCSSRGSGRAWRPAWVRIMRRLSALNPKLVYCSITGYGQDGPRALEAGHDINYIAVSGVLGAIGPAGQPPQPPLNLVADFAGGSLIAAFGIMAALFEARRSGKGQYIDAAMIDGCLSLMAMHFPPGYGDAGTRRWPARGKRAVLSLLPLRGREICRGRCAGARIFPDALADAGPRRCAGSWRPRKLAA